MYTLLENMLEKGFIYMDDKTYVGKSYDGIVVEFGMIGDEDKIEEYLMHYPTPEYW